MELEALQEIGPQVRTAGARTVAITAELERYTRGVHKETDLSFDILTDLHLSVAEKFGLAFTLPDYLRELYKSFGSTLDRFHDEPEYRLPMPARYVIGQDGVIRAAGSSPRAHFATENKMRRGGLRKRPPRRKSHPQLLAR
jgi:peroxiredoxin